MTVSIRVHAGPRVVGRLQRGDNLRDALLSIAASHDIHFASVSAIGAFTRASFCEYDQHAQRYLEPIAFDGGMEVLSLNGNLSVLDGAPFLHVHALCSKEVTGADGHRRIETFGGHIVEAHVFALEFVIDGHGGEPLHRAHDDVTGLALWKA